jgi:hypothetical protein
MVNIQGNELTTHVHSLSLLDIKDTLIFLSEIDKQMGILIKKGITERNSIIQKIIDGKVTLCIPTTNTNEATELSQNNYEELIEIQENIENQLAERLTIIDTIQSYGYNTDPTEFTSKTNDQLKLMRDSDSMKYDNKQNQREILISSSAPLVDVPVPDLLEEITRTNNNNNVPHPPLYRPPPPPPPVVPTSTTVSGVPPPPPPPPPGSVVGTTPGNVKQMQDKLFLLSNKYKEMMGIFGDDYTVFLRNLKTSHETRKRMYYMTQQFVEDINDLIAESKSRNIKFSTNATSFLDFSKKFEIMLSKEAILKGLIGTRTMKFGSLQKIKSAYKFYEFKNLMSFTDANQLYYDLVRTKILTLVSLTSIIFSYVYNPGQNTVLDAFVHDAIQHRGAVAHQIIIQDREYPLITFYDIEDANKFDKLMTPTSGIYWVDLTLRLNDNTNPSNAGFFFRKFITPPILSKFVDYFEDLEGEYEDDTSIDDSNGGDNAGVVTKFVKWFFRFGEKK